MQNLISFNEAKNMLQVSRQSIHNYVTKGLLTPHKKFNGRVFFDKQQVVELQNLNYENANHFVKKDIENRQN